MTAHPTTIQAKVEKLSPKLQGEIHFGERPYTPDPETPVTNMLVATKRHCNGGKTVDSGLWLRDHCTRGGKVVVSLAGAASSFQIGAAGLCDLIRAGHVAAISATGANMEESLYRLIAHDFYAYVRNYAKLTAEEEKELDDAGFRRITDTFLPEEESVRLVLDHLLEILYAAEEAGERLFWHEYFFRLFERIEKGQVEGLDPAKLDFGNCWLYQAWKGGVRVFVPGIEDSTMGNIIAWACYAGGHEFLSRYTPKRLVNPAVIRHSFEYMHLAAEWYMDEAKERGLAFLQLGGGIAGDFLICVVPHLQKDYLAELSREEQERLVRPWAGFIEIHTSPMSVGSYSGAGGDEKITWSKLNIASFKAQIFGDFLAIFPDIAAIILRR